MTSKPMIAYPTILAATQGDPEAVQTILRYYAPYILHFSKCSAQLEDGIIYSYVNHEVKQQIEAKLMYGIVTQFDPFSLPPRRNPGRVLTDQPSATHRSCARRWHMTAP